MTRQTQKINNLVRRDNIQVNLSSLYHEDLSIIYKTFHYSKWLHPQNAEPGPVRTFGQFFFFIQDTSKTGLQREANLEKTLKISQSDEAEVVKQDM